MKNTFWRLLKLAAPFARWMILAVVLGVATILSSIGLMTTAAYIIARAALQPSIADLQVAIVGVRFFGIARGGFRYLERYVSHQVTFRLLARLRVWFYTELEPLAPARLWRYRSGDLFSRIIADVETLQDFFLRVLAPPLVALCVGIAVTCFVGSFDPSLAAVLLVFFLLGGGALPALTRWLGRRPGRQLVQVRADLNDTLLDGIQGIADLLAYRQEGRYYAKIHRTSQALGQLQEQMARIGGLHAAVGGLLMNLATLAVLVAAIPPVRSGELDGVFLALLVLAVISSFEAVLPLPGAFQYLETSLEAARRLFEIVDTEPEIVDRPAVAGLPEATPANYDLSVAGLCFSYSPESAPALDGISFELPQGKRLAIVGPSGAGKTTLVRLLLRFWDYSSGRISLGGRDLATYSQNTVRDAMAVVSQETHLFNATVRENLLLSRPEASEADLMRAARQAQIHDFIESLPQGYDTWIGERGMRLSGGQRQRLAIARALLKDAPILILDEPTANLDALSQRDVLQALEGLMVGRTVLIITHHLAGLAAVDEILVLRAGRIAERGSHRSLLALGGLYRRMWDLQNEVLPL